MVKTLLQEATEFAEELTKWRRYLHRHPELDMILPETVAFVKEQLKEMGIAYTVSEKAGYVTALIGEGKHCFLLRSDMDALPVREESGVEFASENGCMHACGHDLHATILLGAAKLLKAHENELKGCVKLLFQPGEETFHGGKAAVEDGILENPHVDAAFAMHVSSTVPVGLIGYGPEPMSSVYGFKITLTGKGGHGSTPEICVDPINAGVQIYLAMQALIARECPSAEEAVLTIGQFDAGNAANIIPERAVLQGTLRTFKKEIAEKMIHRIEEVINTVAETYRTKAELEVLYNVPAVNCTEDVIKECVDSIQELNPDFQILPLYHVMGSEDFAFISDCVPNAYFAIGAGVDDQSKWVGQHNPKVQFHEASLPIGAAAYAKVAMDWLEKHGDE